MLFDLQCVVWFEAIDGISRWFPCGGIEERLKVGLTVPCGGTKQTVSIPCGGTIWALTIPCGETFANRVGLGRTGGLTENLRVG